MLINRGGTEKNKKKKSCLEKINNKLETYALNGLIKHEVDAEQLQLYSVFAFKVEINFGLGQLKSTSI